MQKIPLNLKSELKILLGTYLGTQKRKTHD